MITVNVPGPWAVDNTLSHHWAIINTETGRRRVVGPASRPGKRTNKNHFDAAVKLAEQRNAALDPYEGKGDVDTTQSDQMNYPNGEQL